MVGSSALVILRGRLQLAGSKLLEQVPRVARRFLARMTLSVK